MNPELRVIIIEDNPDDAWLVLRELEHAHAGERTRAARRGHQRPRNPGFVFARNAE